MAGKYIVLYYVRTEECVRIGFSTARGVPGAVARNRIRRLLRAAWRCEHTDVASGVDIILIGRRAAAQVGVADIRSDLESVLRKAGLKGGGTA